MFSRVAPASSASAAVAGVFQELDVTLNVFRCRRGEHDRRRLEQDKSSRITEIPKAPAIRSRP